MAHTRMQRALPITVADKLRTWREPLQRHLVRIAEVTPRLLVVQFAGPVGARSGLDVRGDAIAAELARRLGLRNGPSWLAERDGPAELANWLSLVSGSLGKIGEDVALMVQNEVGQAQLSGGGASSAMAHKSNPVQAEILVTLARFNASLLAGQHHALVHENERSGAAWTLEWLVLPQMLAAAGANLANRVRALCRIAVPRGPPLTKLSIMLNASSPLFRGHDTKTPALERAVCPHKDFALSRSAYF
jgi:3-carboxy-cis,cis-muconate cycloisomerase